MIKKLDSKKFIIGFKEIVKMIKGNRIEHVVFANNCPEWIIKNIKAFKIKTGTFDGDGESLGMNLGKPFPVAVVGYVKSSEKNI